MGIGGECQRPVYVELYVFGTGESDETDPGEYLEATVLQGTDPDAAIYESEDGETTDIGILASCWTIDGGSGALGRFTLVTPLDEIEDQITALEEILETVEV